jgi:hypothetical protein
MESIHFSISPSGGIGFLVDAVTVRPGPQAPCIESLQVSPKGVATLTWTGDVGVSYGVQGSLFADPSRSAWATVGYPTTALSLQVSTAADGVSTGVIRRGGENATLPPTFSRYVESGSKKYFGTLTSGLNQPRRSR